MNFKVDKGEEGQETELPALKLIHALGYDYKTNFELNQERTDHRQAILYDRLRAAIKRLNNLDDEGVEDAIRQIHEDAYPANLDLVDANERVRTKLVGLSKEDAIEQPISVKQYGENGLEYVTVKFFDFDDPKNNDFLVTNQFIMEGFKSNNIEPDIVVFVNGLPLIVIECKKPSSRDYLKEAWESNLEKYQRIGLGFRKLFYYNHAIIVTCDIAAKCGTINALPNKYAKWTSLHGITLDDLEEIVQRVPSPQDIILAGMLNKKSLLDMLKNFVIYETEHNKKIKKIAKHQQYRVVTKCVDRIKEGKEVTDQGGVVWHTQGSGKSLSMVWFATQLLYKLDNPPILIITDRRQLDKQIHGTFKACGFPEPIKAKNIKHLAEELKHPQGKTIMTTIQKFGSPGDIHTDERVIVLVDEAHRSQFGWNSSYMRDAMRNAVFFGFSGTPIDKESKSTFQVFGPLVDKYSFQEAKDDGATLGVLHEGLLPNLYLEGGETIDQIFDRVFTDLTGDQKAELKRKYANKSDIAEAPERIKKIVDNIIDHYNSAIGKNNYKGMIVASSREAAVIYYRELKKRGGPLSKVVMTCEPDEMGKDGTSWKEFYMSDAEREKVTDQFKSDEDPTKLLIVVDMLLVGYDVPIVQVMYLDKSLKEHSLHQAMARVNRLYDAGKTYGLIIDYIGVLKNLQKALEIFESEDVEEYTNALDTLDGELIELDARDKVLMDLIKEFKDKEKSDIILAFESEDSQIELESTFKSFVKALDVVKHKKESLKYKEDFDFACKIRAYIRTAYHGDKPDNREYSVAIQQLIDDHIKSTGVSELTNPKEITYENFLAYAGTYKKDAAKAAMIKNKGMQVIRERQHTNPGYYGKLRERLEKLLIDVKEKRLENAAYFDLLCDIYKEAISGEEITEKETGIKDEFERAIYYLLEPETDDKEFRKNIAKTIHDDIKKQISIVDWKEKTETNNEIYLATYDNLPSDKFSKEKREQLAEEILKIVRSTL